MAEASCDAVRAKAQAHGPGPMQGGDSNEGLFEPAAAMKSLEPPQLVRVQSLNEKGKRSGRGRGRGKAFASRTRLHGGERIARTRSWQKLSWQRHAVNPTDFQKQSTSSGYPGGDAKRNLFQDGPRNVERLSSAPAVVSSQSQYSNLARHRGALNVDGINSARGDTDLKSSDSESMASSSAELYSSMRHERQRNGNDKYAPGLLVAKVEGDSASRGGRGGDGEEPASARARVQPIPASHSSSSLLGTGVKVHAAKNIATMDSNKEPSWRKILWKRQRFMDNYVDPTFLSSLRYMHRETQLDYPSMVKNTAVVMQELCIVIIFSTVFKLTLTEDVQSAPDSTTPSISLQSLVFIDVATITLTYLLQIHLEGKLDNPKKTLLSSPRMLVLFLVILMAASPVLHTLTSSYSTDTIYVLAVLLGAIHLFFFDFAYMLGMTETIRCTVSMNAAILCAVLLASRLSSDVHCFALMVFALELFVLTPILRHTILLYSETVHLVMTVILTLSIIILLGFTHRLIFTVFFCLASVAFPFGAPKVFMWVQRWKQRMAGPWDLGGAPASAGAVGIPLAKQ